MERPSEIRRTWQDACFCALALAFLFAPAVAWLTQGPDRDAMLAENRAPALFPEPPTDIVSLANWPRAFEAWYDDHFGLRPQLVRAHNRVKLFVLDASPSETLAMGRDHWVFLDDTGLTSWRGADPFTVGQLEAWRLALESRQRVLAAQGATYVFALAPSKPQVYPEKLSARFRRGGPSRTDQLIEYLEQHSSVRILDLRECLLEEKKRDGPDDFTYFPLGIHWAARGAAAGARAIGEVCAKTAPAIGAIDMSFDSGPVMAVEGDTWAPRMYVRDLLKQTVRDVVYRTPLALRAGEMDEQRQRVVERDGTDLPRALVFHDSFGEPLFDSLGRLFSRIVLVWRTELDPVLIAAERPDFVIHVLNDRMLTSHQPSEYDDSIGLRLAKAFEASTSVAWKLDPAANSPRVDVFSNARIDHRVQDGVTKLALTMEDPAGTFLLPPIPPREGFHPLLRMELESPINSSTHLMYMTHADPRYIRKRQIVRETSTGANVLYFEILDPDFTGRPRLLPGREPGSYWIGALEVRWIED